MDVVVAILVRILEFMFAAGMVGSAAVILLTTLEDIKVFFEPDEPARPSV